MPGLIQVGSINNRERGMILSQFYARQGPSWASRNEPDSSRYKSGLSQERYRMKRKMVGGVELGVILRSGQGVARLTGVRDVMCSRDTCWVSMDIASSAETLAAPSSMHCVVTEVQGNNGVREGTW